MPAKTPPKTEPKTEPKTKREPRTFQPKLLKLDAQDIASADEALTFLEEIGKEYDADEAVIRYARRELALYKDAARKAAGIAASHRYTPDLSRVESVKVLSDAAVYLENVAETYREPEEVKPTRKVAAK